MIRLSIIVILTITVTVCETPFAQPAAGWDDPSRVLIPFLTEKGWGYADSNGKLVIPGRYCGVSGVFSEGRASAGGCGTDRGLYGYIDQQGRWIVKPRFTSADDFRAGEALARVSDSSPERLTNFLRKHFPIYEGRGSDTEVIKRTTVTYRLDADGKILSQIEQSDTNVSAESYESKDNAEKWFADLPSLRAEKAEKHEWDMPERKRMSNLAQWRKLAASCGYQLARKLPPNDSRDDWWSISDNYAVDDYAVVTSSKKEGLGVIDKQCHLVVPFGVYGDETVIEKRKGEMVKKTADFRLLNHFLMAKRKGQGYGVLDVAKNVELMPFDRLTSQEIDLFHEINSIREPEGAGFAVRDDHQRWTVFDAAGKRLCGGFSKIYYPGVRRRSEATLNVHGQAPVIAVMDENQRWGALAPDGTWIFEPRYDTGFYFDEAGYARVSAVIELDGKKREAQFFVDRSGREFRTNGKTGSDYFGVRCESH